MDRSANLEFTFSCLALVPLKFAENLLLHVVRTRRCYFRQGLCSRGGVTGVMKVILADYVLFCHY